MILLKYNLENAQRGKIYYTHYKPEILSENDIKDGILVESLPIPISSQGKRHELYINPETNELWYEYVDIPKTQEQILQEKVDLMQQALDDLILNGGV